MSTQLGEIAFIFLAFRDQLKLYHWTTHSYPKHKASDMLVTNITDQMDKFMETVQGSRGIRLKVPKKNTIMFEQQTDVSIVNVIEAFKNWLLNILPSYLEPFDDDLKNIRDEILSSVNQTLYLFTLG